ncbi:pirin family protein [Homoserinibacter sp. YIM 151385]|uniref:pirin family protein n=1 Tax=Homoserinibacter sp. YIM 151385 TaxID=2985506 RepID=UPI0022F0A1F4|nr:pirin family protein [Homoserinibacter sp. YIM 151385]WBU37564.1 pirin family protein [Homoserinibacter sp. YIM 151385]
MSNLETQPEERVCAGEGDGATGARSPLEILEPRDVPLGGPRAMQVRRTLPQRRRSLIGAWCFVDHYGPEPIAGTRTMDVPPHPHTGLQTVSWLFEGEIEHRDATGAHALVRPGELDLMTAGRGIQHSEYSTTATGTLHGAQLWIALPEGARGMPPAFEQVVSRRAELGDAVLRVFVGSLAGAVSPAVVHTPLVAAQLDLPAGGSVTLPVDETFEHGLLVDAGAPRLEGVEVAADHLAYAAPGRTSLRIEAGAEPVRAILIGGEPLGERIVMWWNFVGRSHEEIVAFRREWQASIAGGDADGAGRFGAIEDPTPPLPAPELPNVRLAPRG